MHHLIPYLAAAAIVLGLLTALLGGYARGRARAERDHAGDYEQGAAEADAAWEAMTGWTRAQAETQLVPGGKWPYAFTNDAATGELPPAPELLDPLPEQTPAAPADWSRLEAEQRGHRVDTSRMFRGALPSADELLAEAERQGFTGPAVPVTPGQEYTATALVPRPSSDPASLLVLCRPPDEEPTTLIGVVVDTPPAEAPETWLDRELAAQDADTAAYLARMTADLHQLAP
jgi:hypothetical protein